MTLDAATRLLPGVVGNEASPHEETFGDEAGFLLEYPHYTRPSEFRGMVVPDVLLSGHHANIAKWRRQMALVRTRARRPDLWEKLLPIITAVVDSVNKAAWVDLSVSSGGAFSAAA